MCRLAVAALGVLASCASHEPPPKPETKAEAKSEPETRGSVALGARLQATIDDVARAEPYIPAEAQYVVSFDVKALAGNQVVVDLWNAFLEQADSDARESFEDLEACGLDPSKVDRLVIAGNSSRTAFSLLGIGAGDPELYRCMNRRSRERGDEDEDDELEVIEGASFTKLTSKEYKGVLPSKHVLVIADGEWGSALIEGFETGQPSLRQPSDELGELFDALPSAHPIKWATLQTSELTMFGQVEAASGSLVGSDPVEAVAYLHAESTEKAEASRDQVRQTWDAMKSMLVSEPAAQPIVDSVEIDTTNTSVRVRVSASQQDLSALTKKLSR